jgi:hypothetical protein
MDSLFSVNVSHFQEWPSLLLIFGNCFASPVSHFILFCFISGLLLDSSVPDGFLYTPFTPH